MDYRMIVPAVLTDEKEELMAMMTLCGSFTDDVQVDFMDGSFVPSTSVGLSDLKDWRPDIGFEAHLMVMDPLKWCRALSHAGARRIIYHFEIEEDHGEIISEIKELKVEAGVAVNPETSLEAFESFVEQLDVVLFLAVNPGFYGAPFIPEVLEKMQAFKEKHPRKQVGIDGGMKLDNVIAAREAGADYVCVGSAILKSPDPEKSYKNFLKLLKGYILNNSA